MSILNVNKINPVGSGSTVTIAGIASVTNNISVGNSVTASSFHGSSANLTGTGLSLNDGVELKLGSSDDLKIWHHSGGNSYIKETGGGSLVINADDFYLQNVATTTFLRTHSSGSIDLNFGGNKKFETTNSGAIVTGICTATSFVPTEGQLSHRNIVVNGDMRIAQRGASSTSSGIHSVDRFGVWHNDTDEAPTQAQVDVASGTSPYIRGFRKALKVTNGNQTGGADAGDYIWIQTNLEAQDIANSGWRYMYSNQYITLSFWVKSSVAQDFKCYLRSRDGTERQYPFSTGSLTANTWTKVTKTIPGNSGLQFDNNNAQGFQINIGCFFGTNLTASGVTENAWGSWSSTARVPDMTSTWYTTNDATFEITGVQLEVGSAETPFEHRSYGEELARCQRYFYKPELNTFLQPAYQYYRTAKMSVVEFPVTMRVTPTCTATWNTAGTFTQYNMSSSHFKAYVVSAYDANESFYLTAFQASAEV